MPAESCLLLLVDDLFEALVQEDGQPLPLIIRRGDVGGVVVGNLGDVIRNIGQKWMMGRTHMTI